MKRLFAAILACVLLVSMFSCGKKPTPVESAQKLIEEGKLAEAYAVLYSADKNDAEAKALLADFKFLPTAENRKTYTMYNGVCEKTFNEHGDITKEVRTESYNGFPRNYVLETEYTYDADGRILTRTSVENGYSNYEETIQYTYDTNGNLIKEHEHRTNTENKSSSEMLTEYKYDSDNNMVELVASTNGEFLYKYEYTYNADGCKASETKTDGLGIIKDTYVYNAKGEMISRTRLLKTDGNEATTIYEYTRNEHGDVVKTVTRYTPNNFLEETNEYTYDNSGRVTSKITRLLDGETRKEYVYNEQGDITKVSNFDTSWENSIVENEITYGKDGKKSFEKTTWNVFKEYNTSIEYDEYGNTTREKSDSIELIYEYTYGTNGQILTKTEVNADGTRRCYEYTYNSDGTNAKTVSYELAENSETRKSETELIYDGKGNLIKKDEKGRRITENTYDEHNNIILTRVTNLSDNKTEENSYQYIYDANGNITERKEIYESGTIRRVYTYNRDGLVESELLYNGKDELFYGSEYFYDEKGNMTENRGANYIDGVKEKENIFTYTYDECGNRLTQVGALDAGNVNISVITYSGYVCFYCPTAK